MKNKYENNFFSANSKQSSLKVLDANGTEVTFERVIFDLAKSGIEETVDIRVISSIDSLRAYEPDSSGDVAIVREYNAGTGVGGGVFIYDENDTTSPEDSGLIIVTEGGARWKRTVDDFNNVNVLFFGAIPDGETDCLPAVQRMWEWSLKNYPSIGIKFPAGNFMISKFDISETEIRQFRLAGDQVNSGYYSATTLYSDKQDGEVMFQVKSRYIEISCLSVDGESTSEHTNTKGFYKNIITAGQFVRVTSVNFMNIGGRSLDMVDTLDCKIDQWYASSCSGTVIYASWSDSVTGSWDHITAIELSNFNIQYCTDNPAIDLQRATQSMIWNGWIEHTEYPGNLSNGQWIINGLSVEDCKNPLECHYARIINHQLNLQSNSTVDLSESGEQWDSISEYEMGDVRIENHGVKINGSLSYNYVSSQNKMDNRSDKEVWFYVGELQHSENTVQSRIRLIGSAAYNSMPTTQTGYSDRTAEGCADIFIQKTGDVNYIGTWVGSGSVPVTRVLLKSGSTSQRIKIYVKLARYTGYCSSLIETNDFDRFSKGVCFLFLKAYTAVSEDESTELDSSEDNCFHQHWCGREGVGFGFNNNNQLLLKGETGVVEDFDTASDCLKVYINDKIYGIELKPLKS